MQPCLPSLSRRLAARLSEAERQHMVARALVGIQAEVIQRYGYEGDAGYAQAQVCLMDHAADAVVTASIAAATNQIYARAGINLQEVIEPVCLAPASQGARLLTKPGDPLPRLCTFRRRFARPPAVRDEDHANR